MQELQAELKKRNLDTKGKKVELEERLAAADLSGAAIDESTKETDDQEVNVNDEAQKAPEAPAAEEAANMKVDATAGATEVASTTEDPAATEEPATSHELERSQCRRYSALCTTHLLFKLQLHRSACDHHPHVLSCLVMLMLRVRM